MLLVRKVSALKNLFPFCWVWRELKEKMVLPSNHNSKFMKNMVNPTIFTGNKENVSKGKPFYKIRELDDKLRVWVKIILGCIHHRPTSSSSYYINFDHKFILYYIMKGIKVNLPSLLFNYLRDIVIEIRSVRKYKKSYIPLIESYRIF